MNILILIMITMKKIVAVTGDFLSVNCHVKDRFGARRVQWVRLERNGFKINCVHVDTTNCAVIHCVIVNFPIRNIGCDCPLGCGRHVESSRLCRLGRAERNIKVVKDMKRLFNRGGRIGLRY